jgi:hypothetical protein
MIEHIKVKGRKKGEKKKAFKIKTLRLSFPTTEIISVLIFQQARVKEYSV